MSEYEPFGDSEEGPGLAPAHPSADGPAPPAAVPGEYAAWPAEQPASASASVPPSLGVYSPWPAQHASAQHASAQHAPALHAPSLSPSPLPRDLGPGQSQGQGGQGAGPEHYRAFDGGSATANAASLQALLSGTSTLSSASRATSSTSSTSRATSSSSSSSPSSMPASSSSPPSPGLEATNPLDLGAHEAGFDDEFQRLFSTVADDTSVLPQTDTFRTLAELVQDFRHAAVTYGKVILAEMHLPAERKTIRPTEVGGFAGGVKFIAGDVLFRLPIDVHDIYGSEELAAKEANHQVKGLTAMYNACISGLSLPLVRLFVSFR